ncbi:YiiX/YebB-like N1pC/P60 family cysteine hydrolase [Pseudoxanthomonas sp. UTMC 1351]|uniref:YiiX/YebB-like N1pC/P60 family cysteine hydrolase n=1 Tax=Pseudoxanthomonas sp. UTMC 1351 TaxID=2695853 RepID=UPI0034CDEDD1
MQRDLTTPPAVELFFTKRRSLGSKLIRLGTWSPWSHVGFRVGDRVIESTAGHGVREVSWRDAVRPEDRRAAMYLRCARPDAVLAAARSQLGKPYDTSAILGFIGRRDWQEPDSWFCSELVAWAFAQAGYALFRPDSVHRVTPGHLWMLAQGVTPTPTE